MNTKAEKMTNEKTDTLDNHSIHFVLQGKGGIGKSLISSSLSQYFKSKFGAVKPFDTDQENTTLLHYKSLEVEHIPLMNQSRVIDAKNFDVLMEKLIGSDECCVIDNGANTFSPLLAYLIENDGFEILRESGKKVYIHTVIGGGDTLVDTATGFNSIAEGVTNTPIILWLNEHFGALSLPTGEKLEELKVYKKNENRLAGIIVLHHRNHQTFGDDIKRMNANRLTLTEVLQSPTFSLMEKQRLKTVFNAIFHQLDTINW
ncbi:MAG TPA: conjugal transfer protein TraL [Arsenophonus apicola]|nr:conjugal transfer protein TraL [Arsenophonus apicola]UBX30745.1 conjugal transfer protein TraL [Arsenophonus apicola]UBX30885.1 conjugal transfer protein TraL [Arsenophonus apicola]